MSISENKDAKPTQRLLLCGATVSRLGEIAVLSNLYKQNRKSNKMKKQKNISQIKEENSLGEQKTLRKPR